MRVSHSKRNRFSSARLAKTAPLEGVSLGVLHAAFDLALVTGHVRLGGQEHACRSAGEGLQLGIDLRVVPVGPGHGGLQVVDHQPLGHAAEIPEGVLQALHEGFRGLPPDGLAVALAAVREHDAEHPRTPPLAVGPDDRRAGAEVHLRLLAGLRLHPPERQRRLPPQPRDEPPHAVVTRRALAVVFDQVLVNPHRRQALLDLRQDLFPEGLALAGRPTGRAWPVVPSAGVGSGPSATSEPVGAFGGFWALAWATYLPTVPRSTSNSSAIARLECSDLWSVRIAPISAMFSRFAIVSPPSAKGC